MTLTFCAKTTIVKNSVINTVQNRRTLWGRTFALVCLPENEFPDFEPLFEPLSISIIFIIIILGNFVWLLDSLPLRLPVLFRVASFPDPCGFAPQAFRLPTRKIQLVTFFFLFSGQPKKSSSKFLQGLGTVAVFGIIRPTGLEPVGFGNMTGIRKLSISRKPLRFFFNFTECPRKKIRKWINTDPFFRFLRSLFRFPFLNFVFEIIFLKNR